MRRKCLHTVQKSSVGCFRTDPVLGLTQKFYRAGIYNLGDVASAV